MGIHCEINLFRPPDETFTPGSTVSGVVKYALDAETEFKNIIISLKGKGALVLIRKIRRHGGRNVFKNREDYVDIDYYISQNQDKKTVVPIGSYESKFSFTLPHNVPSSLKYSGSTPKFTIKCHIQYHIRIKFVRSGFLVFDRRFRKVIRVVSGITPRLPVEPAMFSERKTLAKLFSSKQSIVNIKGTIQNCVIKPGGKIEFDYEITNDTNVTVKGIKTKLTEIYTFTRKIGRQVKKAEDVADTKSKTGSIKSGETKSMSIEITVPEDRISLENSEIVSRDYVVRIIIKLPLPHRNAVLHIPVQIGDTDEACCAPAYDPPPSYWEVTGEDNNDDEYYFNNDKGRKS